MTAPPPPPAGAPADRLARQLVLDEVFDLSLYRTLRNIAQGELRAVLDELISVETRHVAFWQEFFGLQGLATLVVGLGFTAGALVPVLPVLFGASGMLPTVVAAGTTIVVVSAIVPFLSGMDVRRCIALNLVITGMAVAVTYSIGLLAKAVCGIAV